jgi:hypothetical protein
VFKCLKTNVKIVVMEAKRADKQQASKCVDYIFSAATTGGGELFW